MSKWIQIKKAAVRCQLYSLVCAIVFNKRKKSAGRSVRIQMRKKKKTNKNLNYLADLSAQLSLISGDPTERP